MKKQKLLIVDDEPQLVKIISDTLEQEGHEIIAAFDGLTAYEIAIRTQPDLIIMDWDMPIMNGIESLKMIKENETIRNIPVIMITGRMTSLSSLKTAFDAGAIDFIRKPIEPVELLARTRSMLMLASFFNEVLRQKDIELDILSKELHKTFNAQEKIIGPLNEVLKNLEETKHPLRSKLRFVAKELKIDAKKKTWTDFSSNFNNVHPEFTSNLLSHIPTLTPEEVRVCVLLRLNLNSKEIAALTFKNPPSVDITRYRIRRKLNISKKESLYNYLSQF